MLLLMTETLMLQARDERAVLTLSQLSLTGPGSSDKETVDHSERVLNSSDSEPVSSPESHKDQDWSV